MTRFFLTASAVIASASIGCLFMAADESVNDRGLFTDAPVGHPLRGFYRYSPFSRSSYRLQTLCNNGQAPASACNHGIA